MTASQPLPISRLIGSIPHRLALAGGWIDQPFVSRLNPNPNGSMVVFSVEPTFRVMSRAGWASSTREMALQLWRGQLPDRPRADLVRELYHAENQDRADPSGSQDMIGLIYPGINRLDYNFAVEGGIFPEHIETLNDPACARWLERSLYLLPIEPRPPGYNPLGEKFLEPEWIARLGQTGKDCFEAIRRMDITRLGQSLNEAMLCWKKLLPQSFRHPTIRTDLEGILAAYQQRYAGAMYSGCGGGYLLVIADEPVPGGFQIKIRTEAK